MRMESIDSLEPFQEAPALCPPNHVGDIWVLVLLLLLGSETAINWDSELAFVIPLLLLLLWGA